MLGPEGRAVQEEQPSPLEDPVDDGLGEVFVVEHMAPCAERFPTRQNFQYVGDGPEGGRASWRHYHRAGAALASEP